jgi:hypothetical protein
MQVSLQPLQLLSRLAAVLIVAIPLALLVVAVDDYERRAIARMTHQELIAFVEEVHSGSYGSAYLRAAIMMLILVALVEATAFVIRRIVGLFAQRKPAEETEVDYENVRTNIFQ